MTQEELDRLMEGDTDEESVAESSSSSNGGNEYEGVTEANYKLSSTSSWPPPPPSNENQVVNQLDDVTRESEEKASQVFDMLEAISNDAMGVEEKVAKLAATIKSNNEIFEKLAAKFANIPVFADLLEKNHAATQLAEDIQNDASSINMNVMTAMDTMQYQDIHRQKIERVINIMRALSNYMNKLFEGRLEDDKRVSSAKHIHGDETDNKDIADEDDIEALIASFGKK
jgi:chemotaxis regulatin CheY-phosphate phosphatase CheZ